MDIWSLVVLFLILSNGNGEFLIFCCLSTKQTPHSFVHCDCEVRVVWDVAIRRERNPIREKKRAVDKVPDLNQTNLSSITYFTCSFVGRRSHPTLMLLACSIFPRLPEYPAYSFSPHQLDDNIPILMNIKCLHIFRLAVGVVQMFDFAFVYMNGVCEWVWTILRRVYIYNSAVHGKNVCWLSSSMVQTN